MRDLLKLTSNLKDHEVEGILSKMAGYRSKIEALEKELVWATKDGKEAYPEKKKELEGTLGRLKNLSQPTREQVTELAKAKKLYQVIQIFEGHYPRPNSPRPLLTDLKEFIAAKLPGQTAVYRSNRANCRWQIFQYAEQKEDYELEDLNRSGKQRKSSSTGKKRGRPPMSPKTPRHAQKRR